MTRRPGSTLVELAVVCAIAVALLGVFLPAVQQARAAATRLQCQGQLRQVALALHGWHDLNSRFPAGTQSGSDPLPWRTWLAEILPLIEQAPLDRVVRSADGQSAGELVRRPGVGVVVGLYGCPADLRTSTAWDVNAGMPNTHPAPVALTSYLGCYGLDHRSGTGVLYLGSRTTLLGVTDGTSHTLLVGERPPSADVRFGWWHSGIGVAGTGALDATLGVRERNPHTRPTQQFSQCPPGPHQYSNGKLDDLCASFHFWSLHAGGANFALCDGSVRFLPYSARDILPALATRAGGEVVALPD